MPDFASQSALIDKVLANDTSVDLSSIVDVLALFSSGTNAGCYGPSIVYATHQDAGSGLDNGTLPSGDLGLWTATDSATGSPCIAAEMSKRVTGVKARAVQGLVLAAAMRGVIAASGGLLAMPAAGSTTDITTAFQTLLRAKVPALTTANVIVATVGLNGAGTTYTYRLVLNTGSMSGLTGIGGEVLLTHTPGASAATQYDGVLQVAVFTNDPDPAFGCTDATDPTNASLYQRSVVSTLKYSRNGSQIDFGSRDSSYCGHPAGSTSSTNWAAEVASLTSDGQLDPTVKLLSNTRGTTNGWRGNFSRFAGSYSRTTVAGDFLYAWQAGTGDSNSRTLAMHTSYDSSSDTRSLQGFFAFAGDVATTGGDLLGMICNWAGPGNSHTPLSFFQSQTASLGPSDSAYVAGTSKITYAPTTSCSSTTTQFELDIGASHSLAVNEGVGTAADLDAPSGSLTVEGEIESRGYAKPSMF